jgi:glutaryl-CoA dehydrogenase
MTTTTQARKIDTPKAMPAPNSDFYQLVELLTPEERTIVKNVRSYMETKVKPVINKYWAEDAFPFELLPSFKELKLGGLGYEGYGCAGGSQKLFGYVAMELARVDASFCTFFGVHSGLAMGSIYLDGSEEQKKKWLPPMARWEKIGCFGESPGPGGLFKKSSKSLPAQKESPAPYQRATRMLVSLAALEPATRPL